MLKKFLIFLLVVIHLPKSYAQENYAHALDLYNNGQTTQALEELNRLLTHDTAHVDALHLRAFIHLQAGDKEKALNDYHRILAIAPTHDGALANRALLYMEQEKYDLALADIDQRLKINPENWLARFDRAYCKALNNDYDGAIEDFKEVIALNPDYAPAYANLGFTKINRLTQGGIVPPQSGQTQDACKDLEKARALGDTTVIQMITRYCTP